LQVILVILLNQTFSICLAHILTIEVRRQMLKVSRELPTFPVVIRDISMCIICEEILYYLFHNLIHHRWFYRVIHKVHHEYNATFGLTANYTTLIEHFLVSYIPPITGFVIMQSHPFTAMLFLSAIVVTTFIHHYGYTFVPHAAEFHEYHHVRCDKNYSFFGVGDMICGTYAVRSSVDRSGVDEAKSCEQPKAVE
jgi:sterol desaturase/sphingolipid hydroxylase (fatty acid hydroxylase superfamily)